MALFKNISQAQLELPDENGLVHVWTAGQTRSASNYFYNYTSAGSSPTTELQLIGDLDGDGTIPSPGVHQDNRLRQPGQSQDYLGSLQANAEREKELIVDLSNENDNERRRLDSRFLGLKALPIINKSNTGDTDTDLTGATSVTLTSGDGPIQINGRRATAADAAANPAVQEGYLYTVFGTITVTDDSEGADSVIYFSVTGTTDFTFVEEDGYPAAAPTAPAAGNSVTTSTPSIAFGAFGNSPQAADSISVDTFFAQSPNTAAKLAAAFDPGHNADGWYFNAQENILFIIEGNDVHHFAATASSTIS